MAQIVIESTIPEEVPEAHYVEPPHLVLTTYDISHEDIILTSICWLIGKLDSVDVIQPPLAGFEEILQQTKNKETSDQLLVFLGMSGIMTIGKQIRITDKNANADYLTKRWRALCAKTGIANIFASKEVTAEQLSRLLVQINSWQGWIKLKNDLRRIILDQALREDLPEDIPNIKRAALAQIRMVLHDAGLRSIRTMCSFIMSYNNAILLPAIARQSASFINIFAELRKQHGAKFPYLKVYPLAGAERLNHRNFPDLYYAAVTTAISNGDLGLEGNYKITDVKTETSKLLIKKYAAKRPLGRESLNMIRARECARDLDVDPATVPAFHEDNEKLKPKRRRLNWSPEYFKKKNN